MSASSEKTARDLAWSIVERLRRECVGKKKDITDDEWAEAIERSLAMYIDPDDQYQDGYDDGYDEGYEDAVEEQGRERKRLREKKRTERAEAKERRGVIKVSR